MHAAQSARIAPRSESELPGHRHVREEEPPSGREHPEDLSEDLVLVGREVQNAVRDHDVHAAVRNRQRLEERLANLDAPAEPALLGQAASHVAHGGCHLEPQRSAAWPDLACSDAKIGPATASVIEHALA